MIEIILIWIKKLFKKHHTRIKKIRMDNCAENRVLQVNSDQQNLKIKFEFTSPGTPQQNSVVERKISNINGKSKDYDEPCWF